MNFSIEKVLMKLFCVYLFGTIFSFSVYAQVDQAHKGMHLLDYSSNNVTKGRLDLSILDLSSSEKGFLLPRMTTAERSGIPVSDLDAGLMIYNTTVDCIEIYNAGRKRWLSTCGAQDPAVFDILSSTCSSITVDGSYAEGKLVDERSNIIFLDVNVSEAGTFNASAIAYNGTNKNGYTFIAKGVFPTAGKYKIVLKGSGKPIKGYGKDTSGNPLGKDTIKFYFNDVESTCVVTNFVDKDFVPLDASFVCNSSTFKIVSEGTYKVNVPLTSDHIIKVPVTVKAPGRGKVYGKISVGGSQTEEINYESTTIDFVKTAVNTVQWITLNPVANTGKPTTSGTLTVNFRAVSNGLQEYDPFANKAITEFANCSHDISVQGDNAKLRFSGSMNFLSSFIAPQGFYMTPRTKMGTNGDSRFYMRINVVVDAPGKYEITTNTQNGVYFKASGTINNAIGSVVPINLIAYGESEKDQPANSQLFIANIKNVDTGANLATSNPVNVEFVYQPMTMLSIGAQGWHPNGNYYKPPTPDQWDAGGKLVKNTNNFGWNGIVRIAELKFIGPLDYAETKANALALMSDSGAGTLSSYLMQADMVFMGGLQRRTDVNPFDKSNSSLDRLANYVRNGGVLVYGESKLGQMTYLAGQLGAFMTNTLKPGTQGIDAATFNDFSSASTLIRGEAGKAFATYDGVTLFGQKIGGSYHVPSGIGEGKDNCISFTIMSGARSLATYNNGGGTFAFQHNTYSFVGVGSDLFMGGNSSFVTTASRNGYPVRTKTVGGNTPEKAPLSVGKGEVVNAWFLLNLVHWAIDEAQYNKTKDVQ